MTRSDAEALVADVKARAARVLVEDGHHTPLMILLPSVSGPPPVLLALGAMMTSEAAKAVGMAAVREAVRATRPAGVVSVLESWVSQRPKVVGGDEPGLGGVLKPRDDPGRREALVVVWEFRLDGESAVWEGMWQQFFRHVHGGEAVALDEVVEAITGEGGVRLAGQFCGLLGGDADSGRIPS